MALPTWFIVFSSAVVMTVYALIYYYVLKPMAIIPYEGVVEKCPRKWVFDDTLKMCKPVYDTICKPFDPDAEIYKSAFDKCAVAKNCGTTWKGLSCS